MSFDAFKRIYDRLMEEYSWKAMYDGFLNKAEEKEVKKHRTIKYFRFTVDSRDGDIWCITFVNRGKNTDKTFRVDTPDSAAEMFAWLDGSDDIW